ncbi:MAG: hypothetical protein JXB49_25980 [Bacteroidales bacterium]|nr:hypothetical protein [Bacteroidales bacterium]
MHVLKVDNPALATALIIQRFLRFAYNVVPIQFSEQNAAGPLPQLNSKGAISFKQTRQASYV